MNNTQRDLFTDKFNDFIDITIEKLIINNLDILNEYKELEVEFNIDGTKKDIYTLSSEIDIKKMQIESDKNELEFKLNQNLINKKEYEEKVNEINNDLKRKILLYDDLIFNIIDRNNIENIKKSIKEKNLNEIDLKRLSLAVRSVADNKIVEFQKNNEEFKIENFSYWNYKYDKIAKSLSKAREVENFILSLIE